MYYVYVYVGETIVQIIENLNLIPSISNPIHQNASHILHLYVSPHFDGQ